MDKEKIIKRECKIHGETDFKLRADGQYQCKKCAQDFVLKRRMAQKNRAIEYKGGECSICGYDKCIDALEFHHLDPLGKDFGLAATGFTISWKRLKSEIDKCILVCSNCHKEIHNKLNINAN